MLPGSRCASAVGSPPVTKTRMPARAARTMVADTVVAPSRPWAMTCGRSLLAVLRTLPPLQAHQLSVVAAAPHSSPVRSASQPSRGAWMCTGAPLHQATLALSPDRRGLALLQVLHGHAKVWWVPSVMTCQNSCACTGCLC